MSETSDSLLCKRLCKNKCELGIKLFGVIMDVMTEAGAV